MAETFWKNNKNFFLAFSTIVGTTVGAGIFGMPYVISKSGVVPGFFYFVLLGGSVLLLHLLFGEIVLRTDGQHRLIGYAQIYLGQREKILATFSNVVGSIGALVAYIIIGGGFLRTIFLPLWDIPAFYWALFFWLTLSIFIFRGIKFIAPLELAMNVIFISIIFFIFVIAIPKFDIQDTVLFDLQNIFSPYGVLLFAFAGWLAIPEAASILQGKEERRLLKKTIVLAALVAAFLYFIFVLAVIGVNGSGISRDALTGLVPILGEKIVILGSIFGVAAVAASFLVLGNYLKNALHYDYKVSWFFSVAVACGVPIVLFLFGFREFIKTIGLVGALIGAFEGVIIIRIFRKAKTISAKIPEYEVRVPEFLLYSLTAVFIVGAILELIYFKIDP